MLPASPAAQSGSSGCGGGNFHARFRSIITFPSITAKCQELKKLLAVASNKDLESIFVPLLAEVFGFVADGVGYGWQVPGFCRKHNWRDYLSMAEFLGSGGPVIEAAYRIMTDPQTKFELRATPLPKSLLSERGGGSASNFIYQRLKLIDDERQSALLLLNPFEYYFFVFALVLIHYQTGSTVSTWVPGEALYPFLLEGYMTAFLPCDGSNVKPLGIVGPSASATRLLQSPPQQQQAVVSPNKSSLLKKHSILFQQSTYAESQVPPVARCSTMAAPPSSSENWRSETIIFLLSELWLSSSRDEQRSFSFTSSPTLTSLPSADLIRVVRMLIKHVHFFANSAGPADAASLDALKRKAIPILRKRLYHFLLHTLNHWPFDASFRIVLETWLSFVQPWRYVGSNPLAGEAEAAGETAKIVHPERWQAFATENILFFTTLLRHQLLRFLRLDLTSNKNAFMLFRICKVYSQEGLVPLLRRAERYVDHSQHCSGELRRRPSSGGGVDDYEKGGVAARQQMADILGPGYTYQSVFDPLFSHYLLQLSTLVVAALKSERELKCATEAEKNKSQSLIASFLSAGGAAAVSEIDLDEVAKTIQYLNFVLCQLSLIFGLPLVEEESASAASGGAAGGGGAVSTDAAVTSASLGGGADSDDDLNMSPQMRYKIVHRLARNENRAMYQGNPDEEPIRSDEISFLVRWLHQLSGRINGRWHRQIADAFNRPDAVVGAAARIVLQPPTSFVHAEKPLIVGIAASPRERVHLPARVSLRPLASIRFVTFFSLFCFLYFFNGVSFVGSAAIVALTIVGVVIAHRMYSN